MRALVNKLSGGSKPRGKGFEIDISKAQVLLQVKDGLSLRSEIRNAAILVEAGQAFSFGASGNLAVMDKMARFGFDTGSAPFAVSARLLSDLSRAEALLRFSIDSNLGKLTTMDYRLSLDKGIFVAITSGKGLKRLEAQWDLAKRQLELDLDLEGFVPLSLTTAAKLDKRFQPWLGLPYSGSLSLSSDLSAAGTFVTMDLTGETPLAMPGGHAQFRLAGKGNMNSIQVSTARIWTPVFDLKFAGDLRPTELAAEGRLSTIYILRPDLKFAGELDIQGAGSSWFAYSALLDINGSSLYDTSVSISFNEDTISYFLETTTERSYGKPDDSDYYISTTPKEYTIEGMEAISQTERAGVTLEGTLALGKEAYLEAGLRLDQFSVGSVGNLLTPFLGDAALAILSPLRIDGDISVFSDFSQISYTSGNTLIVHEGLSSAFGVVSYSGTSEYLEIRKMDASINGYALSGSGSIDYSSSAGLGYTVGLEIQDIPYRFSGNVYGDSLFMTGDYDFNLSMRGLGGEIVAQLGFDKLPLQVKETVLAVGLQSTVRFSGIDNWAVVVEHAELEPASSGTSRLPSILLAGSFNQSGGRISRLGLSDNISSLDGSSDVRWNYQKGLTITVKGDLKALDGE